MSQHAAPHPEADDLEVLGEELASADALDADARLELLRRIEAGIAAALDGLDGL